MTDEQDHCVIMCDCVIMKASSLTKAAQYEQKQDTAKCVGRASRATLADIPDEHDGDIFSFSSMNCLPG